METSWMRGMHVVCQEAAKGMTLARKRDADTSALVGASYGQCPAKCPQPGSSQVPILRATQIRCGLYNALASCLGVPVLDRL